MLAPRCLVIQTRILISVLSVSVLTRVVSAGSFELAVLRMTRYYDVNQNCVVYGDTLLPMEAFLTTETVEMKLVNNVFEFAKTIAELKLTDTELGLYSALVLLQAGKEQDSVGSSADDGALDGWGWHQFCHPVCCFTPSVTGTVSLRLHPHPLPQPDPLTRLTTHVTLTRIVTRLF